MKRSTRCLLAYLFVGLFLGGCVVSTANYQGGMADEDTVVPLVVKTELQRWQDLYVVVDYRFQPEGDKLIIDGIFQFADFPRMQLAGVHDFTLKVFLLDADRQVISSADLHRVLGRALERKAPFRREISLPTGIAAVSFGYKGQFVEERGGGTGDVWRLPSRN